MTVAALLSPFEFGTEVEQLGDRGFVLTSECVHQPGHDSGFTESADTRGTGLVSGLLESGHVRRSVRHEVGGCQRIQVVDDGVDIGEILGHVNSPSRSSSHLGEVTCVKDVCPRQDSNLRPFAPEANALSPELRGRTGFSRRACWAVRKTSACATRVEITPRAAAAHPSPRASASSESTHSSALPPWTSPG